MSESSHRLPSTPMLSNRVYNALKVLSTMLLPAASALYLSLDQIWDLPRETEVVGTVAAVNVFVGVLIGLSTKSYNNSDAKYDGAIDVYEDTNEDRTVFSLNLNEDPENLKSMSSVNFKVNKY